MSTKMKNIQKFISVNTSLFPNPISGEKISANRSNGNMLLSQSILICRVLLFHLIHVFQKCVDV